MMKRREFDTKAFTVENFESFMRSFYGEHVQMSHLTTCPMAQFSKHIAGLKEPSASYTDVTDQASHTVYSLPEWGQQVASVFTMHWRTLSIEDIINIAKEADTAKAEEKEKVTA